ncbi:outer membrane protein assembly factor BamA [Robiginitalea sp. SC105]|uniref:outer membrane protein assembly factor BamA n=1 Tax=Robiginitalea sp. SC105 TaxID=2762332 RepID=UPI00163B2FEB|nr:outer membrane protein assembly factor BamA [Robiginitalea sp. SC105]MBC2838906.1 outer membrane protein assembly factor BamA [Robiginitalea sp. SC105]
MPAFVSLRGLLLTLAFLLTLPLLAQDTSYQNSRTYILGGLKVTGLQSYNEQTVKTYTGLREGQPITVPGDQISDIIKKLWGLDLFSDVTFYIERVEGEEIFLELNIQERPSLNNVTFYGIPKRKVSDIQDDTDLKKGKKITESLIANTKNFLENKYRKQGFLNARVTIATSVDTSETNARNMVINIDRGERVKIKNINFEGNEQLSDGKLRRSLKNTKEKRFGRFWKKSKYIEVDYQEDLKSLIDKYAENGYRDARVLSDSIERLSKNKINIHIEVEEGDKYYFGEIDFVGNTVYTDRQLNQVLGIKKGDTYNGVLLRKRIADDTKPDGEDLTNLYQNNGYLFSQINPVEVSAENDTIDFEIRIIEGKETFLNRVSVSGNNKTNDHVIYRDIRTKPGQRYSKEDIIRTIRELGQLGFFDPEQIKPEIENPNPNEGTVDLKFDLVESGASQIELQGGYGGGGFIGTLGLSFNNFSIQNLFNGKAYSPVPMGDGQTFALRLQASRTFRVYSLSFSEPWLGGRKPVRFSLSLSRTQQFLARFNNSGRVDVDKNQQFSITGISAGLAKRVQWPDDFFVLSHSVSYQIYDFKNYRTGLFNFGNGRSNSLAYTIGVTRNSSGPGPIFPLYGSNIELSGKFTPPYSLFSDKDFGALKQESEEIVREQIENAQLGQPSDPALQQRLEELDQERFRWLEYYKIKFRADWYTRIVDKLVLRTNAEFGFLGSYNADVGKVPFERFFLGGDGLGRNFTLDGRETIQLRGYENNSLTPVDPLTQDQEGGIVYNKYSMELRYPLTLKPTASIYTLIFAEAGNSFNNFQEFNPFEIKRSAGVGLRIFMPAFGLLGIDFGYGFDDDLRPDNNPGPSGWQTHFIIGQQF